MSAVVRERLLATGHDRSPGLTRLALIQASEHLWLVSLRQVVDHGPWQVNTFERQRIMMLPSSQLLHSAPPSRLSS